MEHVIENIFNNLKINKDEIFIPKRGKLPSISNKDIVKALLIYGDGPSAVKSLGRGTRSFNACILKLSNGHSLSGGGENWRYWLLSISEYKHCGNCSQIKLKTSFNFDKSTPDTLSRKCKDCTKSINKSWYDSNKQYHRDYLKEHRQEYNARNAKRRALLLERTVRWADLDKITDIYRNCPEGHHVDHYYPLQGETVSGLHVENNLQYLTAKDNLSKGNKMPRGPMEKLVNSGNLKFLA
jgi:hypothetical protein